MAATVFSVDTTPLKRQLQLTNYAESFESSPRYHVRRISFSISILGGDDVVTPPSAEDQQVLSWQDKTENLQDDVEVRSVLTRLSGKLCPYKNISLTHSGKVTDQDTHQQRIEPHPLSAFRHVSFRSAMLTKHSAPDGQIHLLFTVDGLPLERSCYRWRSHDYVKLNLSEPRSSYEPRSYKAFWLAQWDIVDKSAPISDGHDATTGRGIISRSCLDHPSEDFQGKSTGKHFGFCGVRRRGNRKSPWIAEVRPKGRKIWIGSFNLPEVAARAADAGYYYYNLQVKFNFSDSPTHLQPIPEDLSDADMDKFVKKEAYRLAQIPPLAWISGNQSNNTSWTRGLTSSQPRDICCGNNYSSDSIRLSPKANFVQGLPRFDDFTPPFMDSGSNLETNQPSTSYCYDPLRETLGSSPEGILWQSPSNGSFPSISPDIWEPSLPPAFNVFTYPEVNNEPDMSNDFGFIA